MKIPIYSHEENADEVMQLLKVMGINKAMTMGYSTGRRCYRILDGPKIS